MPRAEEVEYLLRNGEDGRNLSSGVNLAARSGNASVVHMLLSKGAPIGRCAVREAIRRLSLDSLEILSALLEYGWNINEEMEWNAPPALS